MMPVVFTEHSVRRYVERYAPWMPLHEARESLERAGQSAMPLGVKTRNGQDLWAIPEPLARLVVVRERGKAIVLTVILEEQDLVSVKPSRRSRRSERL